MDHISATKLLIFVLVCAAFNTGLIWLVQLVHYPSFMHFKSEEFGAFHQFHTKAISFIVAPSMGLELIASVLYLSYSSRAPVVYIITMVLLALIWGITFFIAVPLHNQLGIHLDSQKVNTLIHINWYRTFGWTLRTIIIGYILMQDISVLGK